MTRLVVIGLVVSLGLLGCEDGAGLLGVQDASVDAGGVGADGGVDAGSEARLVLPRETLLVNVDATHGRLFLEAWQVGLVALHLGTGGLELLTADPAQTDGPMASPIGEGVVFHEPHRVVVDPGPGRARIVVEGEMFVVVGEVVLVALPALHRVDPRTGEVSRLVDGLDPVGFYVVPGGAEVAKALSRGLESWTYFAETDTLVSNGRSPMRALRRGALVEASSASSRLITVEGTKELPFSLVPSPDLICGMRGTTALLQQVEGLPDWQEVEVGQMLVGAGPSARGCSYLGEDGSVTWVGLDGALHRLIDPDMPVPGADLGRGVSLVLTDPPSLITNERGLLQLSLPRGFELPENVARALPRGDYLRLVGARIISSEPYVAEPVHADVELTTGRVHPRDMQGLLLGQHQPGSGRWLGATDRVSPLATGPTIPYAVNVETGERRALSTVPVALPAKNGPDTLDSVITVGDRAVYFEQVFEGDEVVALRPVIVDL